MIATDIHEPGRLERVDTDDPDGARGHTGRDRTIRDVSAVRRGVLHNGRYPEGERRALVRLASLPRGPL